MRTQHTIVFDLGNVLLNLDFDRYVRGASRTSGRDSQSIRNRYIKGERKRKFERGQTTTDDFISEMAEWLSWPSGEYERLIHLWCDVFDPSVEAEFLLPRFAERYRLWLFSDTNPLHWRYLIHSFPMLNEFSRYFLSYEMGALKIDPGAFENIVQEAGGQADCLLFFDDLPENIAAAKRSGLDARQFRTWSDVEKAVSEIGGQLK